MPDESQKTLSRIRTFAGDLDTEREKRGKVKPPVPQKKREDSSPVAHSTKTPPKPKPIPKSAPVKQVPKITVEAKKKKKPADYKKRPVPTKPIPHVDEKPPKRVAKIDSEPDKKTDTPMPTKIPAFHELKRLDKSKKAKETTVVLPDQKKKEPTTEEPLPRSVVGYDSTIITDTKTNRFKLFPSMIDSIKSWFKKVLSKRKRRPTPKYTVPETGRRKGVIQKATSKTGTTFTADNESLKEQIRKRQKGEPLLEADELETTWSPYTESGYDLLEAPDEDETSDYTTNVVVEYRRQRTLPWLRKEAVRPETPEEELEEAGPQLQQPPEEKGKLVPQPESEQKEPVAPTPEPDSELKPESEPERPAEVTPPAPTMEIPKPPEPPEPEPEQEEPEPEPEQEEPAVPEQKEPETTDSTPVKERTVSNFFHSKFLDRYDTNTLAITFVVMVVGFIAIVLLTHAIFVGVKDRFFTPETTPTITAEPVLQNTQLVTITVNTQNLHQLPQLIKTAISSAPAGTVELPIVSLDGNDVSAPYLFETLQFHTAPSLKQSLIASRFITVDQSDPALIINFIDKETVHGGLLNWEQALAADLQPLYDKPLNQDIAFIDETVEGVDVRSLKFEDSELLIYGFISDNTLLIAPDTTVFTQLLLSEKAN